MRAVSDLEKLSDAVMDRAKRIRARYRYLRSSSAPVDGSGVSYCVIELDNLVVSALRQFTISCLGGCRTKSKHRVVADHRFDQEAAAAAYILSVTNPTKFVAIGSPPFVQRNLEGTMRDPKDIDKVFAACSASNRPSLQSALALNTTLFRDLATFRNFYAHRNDDTWRKAKNKALALGFPNIKHLDEAILKSAGVGPGTVFDEWLIDTEIFFDQVVS